MLENTHYIFDIVSVVGTFFYFFIGIMINNKIKDLRLDLSERFNKVEIDRNNIRNIIENHAKNCDEDRKYLRQKIDTL